MFQFTNFQFVKSKQILNFNFQINSNLLITNMFKLKIKNTNLYWLVAISLGLSLTWFLTINYVVRLGPGASIVLHSNAFGVDYFSNRASLLSIPSIATIFILSDIFLGFKSKESRWRLAFFLTANLLTFYFLFLISWIIKINS